MFERSSHVAPLNGGQNLCFALVARRNLAKRHFIREVTDSRVEDLRNAIFDTSTPEDRKLIETAVEMQEKIRYRDTAIAP